MESQQRINLRWPLGDDSFVAFELYVADGSLPLDCFEQLGNVVHEIEGLVDMVCPVENEEQTEAFVSEVVAKINEFGARVRTEMNHDNHIVSEPSCSLCVPEEVEEPAPPFTVGQLVRHRSLPERVGRVVSVAPNGTIGVVPEDEVDHTMSGGWPASLLEPVPIHPARKPLKIGQTVQHRDHVGCIGTVLELGGTDRRGYVLVESTSSLAPADGWWSIDNALPYSGVF